MKYPLLIVASCFGVLLGPYAFAQAEAPSSPTAEVDVPIIDLCRVIETLPGKKDPLRKSSAFRKVIRGLHTDIRSTAAGKPLDRKRAKRHVANLEKALGKTLASAQKAFHLDAEARWSRSHQSRAKKFLKAHVFTRSGSLRVKTCAFRNFFARL